MTISQIVGSFLRQQDKKTTIPQNISDVPRVRQQNNKTSSQQFIKNISDVAHVRQQYNTVLESWTFSVVNH